MPAPRPHRARAPAARINLPPTTIIDVLVKPLNVPLNEPFAIATATRTRAENVMISVRLADGTVGFGECAPLSAFSRETQSSALTAARAAAGWLMGQDATRFTHISRLMEERLQNRSSVRAGLEMAVLDAWARHRRLPLRVWFGGSCDRVFTDVTVTIVPPAAAERAAQRILRRGISAIKIKVGKDPDEDEARVRAVARAAPGAKLLVDANQGYDAATAVRFLGRLKRAGIRPILFEQPVAKDDWAGMTKVSREGGVPVAADETVSGRKDALRMARARAAAVVNIKLMKCGIAEALDVARIARAAGLGLMIGGMIESRLAMVCAVHFAAGLGGFRFVDLDTPLWFSRDPMRGVPIRRGGLYDLRPVRAGIGVRPIRL